jgi:hypothetical protein
VRCSRPEPWAAQPIFGSKKQKYRARPAVPNWASPCASKFSYLDKATATPHACATLLTSVGPGIPRRQAVRAMETLPGPGCPLPTIWACPKLLGGRVALSCRMRHLLPALLASLGLAAFVFSAISPGDDDIQQEFLHQRPGFSRTIGARAARAAQPGSSRVLFGRLPPAPLPPGLQSDISRWADETGTSVISRVRPSGDRSPPAC